jgi:tetratricopeptide (TPR) repeat protein
MKMNSEREKLERYTEALDNLPVGVQAKKMSAVKSPLTLRRFVSREAPHRLASRFAMRVNEVMEACPEDIMFLEYGRMMMLNNRLDEAFTFYNAAMDEGDFEAAYEMGRLMMAAGKYDFAAGYFRLALDHRVKEEDSLAMIGIALALSNEKEQARGYFKHAIRSGKGGKAVFCSGMLQMLDGNREKGEEEFWRALESGDETAGMFLVSTCAMRGDLQGLKRAFGRLVQIGIVTMYLPMAQLYEKLGDDDGSLACYRNAVALKVPDAVKYFTDYCARTGRVELAEDYLEERIQKGDIQLLRNLASMEMRTGRIREGLHCCDRLYKAGFGEIAEIILHKSVKMHGSSVYMSMMDALKEGDSFGDEVLMFVSSRADKRMAEEAVRGLN